MNSGESVKGNEDRGEGESASTGSSPARVVRELPPPPPVQNLFIGLLPEIWEKIFMEHLMDDPKSLYNCYNTCPVWKNILESKRTLFLFSLVAPILKENHLTPACGFLQCRTICKTWRKGVDQSFTRLPYMKRDTSIHAGLPPFIWYNDTVGVEFSTSADIEEFIKDFPDLGAKGNPFFHKTVKCISRTLKNDAETNRLFSDFSRLISEHGDSIESCVYMACGGRPDCERRMEGLFYHLPNLQSLAIVKNCPPLPLEGPQNVGLQWLLNRTEPLPPLPHLTSINIYLDDAAPISDLLLLSYGAQIQSFQCDFRVLNWGNYFRGPVAQYSFGNLRELDIFDAFGSSQFLQRLLLFEMPYLEKITLEYVEFGPRRQSFMSIMRVLRRFSRNLQEIRLPLKLFNWDTEPDPENNNEGNEGGGGGAGAQVPQLQNPLFPRVHRLGLNIEVLECPIKHWFLSQFPALTTLCVTNYGVSFGFGLGNQEQENGLRGKVAPFWDLCPSLVKITVERAYLEQLHFYRRE